MGTALVSGIQRTTSNILLRSLMPADYVKLRPQLERVAIQPRDLIMGQDQQIHFVDFPETAVVAITEAPHHTVPCMTAFVGCEGFIGWSALMGCASSPYDVRNGREQSTVLRIELAALLAICIERATLASHLFRFIQALMVQMSSTVVSTKSDTVERRVARMLLMYHDRIDGDDICVTHQDVADLLSIRRAV